MNIDVTFIGTATLMLDIAGLRFVTDPVLDPAGTTYQQELAGGLSVGMERRTGPARAAADLEPIDAVLLSHDHHYDNLDTAGRALVAAVPRTLTTRSGADRLGGTASGLEPWEACDLEGDGATIRVTATPARHGPAGLEAYYGDVVGFLVEADDADGAVWISGDTVLFDDLRALADRGPISVAPCAHRCGRRPASTAAASDA